MLVAARLDRITRRAHTLSQLLEDGISIRAADMPGADDLMMSIYAAMAQKERKLISARSKAALAAAKAREWFDQQGVDMLVGGTTSSTGLAMSAIAKEKKKVFLAVGPATSALTNEQCSPYTVHWAYDTVALAKVAGTALVTARFTTLFPDLPPESLGRYAALILVSYGLMFTSALERPARRPPVGKLADRH